MRFRHPVEHLQANVLFALPPKPWRVRGGHAVFSDPDGSNGSLAITSTAVWASVTLTTLPSAIPPAFAGRYITGLNVLQGVRSPLRPIYFPVYASCGCYQLPRNTRYGWVASPYPAGTFTLQEAPSFAWRTNVAPASDVSLERTRESEMWRSPSRYSGAALDPLLGDVGLPRKRGHEVKRILRYLT